MKNNKTRSIAFSPREEDMINDLKDHLGLKNPSAIVHYAIVELYRSVFPAYKTNPLSLDPDNLQRKAKAKVALKALETQAEAEMKLQPRIDCCVNDFKGKVKDGICYFTAYSTNKKLDTLEEIDLNSCYPEIAESRVYLPSKEAVLKARPDLFKLINKIK